MSEATITLTLPEQVLQQMSEIAGNVHRPVEDVLLDDAYVQIAFTGTIDLEVMLNSLASYSDEILWKVVEYRIPWVRLQQRRDLVEQSLLSDGERIELEVLVEEFDRFVAVRSEALLLLKRRGYDVERYLKERG